MYDMKIFLQQLPNNLQLQSHYNWLEEEEKLGDKAKDVVERVLANADQDFNNRIVQTVEDIAEKVYNDSWHLYVRIQVTPIVLQ